MAKRLHQRILLLREQSGQSLSGQDRPILLAWVANQNTELGDGDDPDDHRETRLKGVIDLHIFCHCKDLKCIKLLKTCFLQGITLNQFLSFGMFLNNLEDFSLAMRIYSIAGQAVTQGTVTYNSLRSRFICCFEFVVNQVSKEKLTIGLYWWLARVTPSEIKSKTFSRWIQESGI